MCVYIYIAGVIYVLGFYELYCYICNSLLLEIYITVLWGFIQFLSNILWIVLFFVVVKLNKQCFFFFKWRKALGTIVIQRKIIFPTNFASTDVVTASLEINLKILFIWWMLFVCDSHFYLTIFFSIIAIVCHYKTYWHFLNKFTVNCWGGMIKNIKHIRSCSVLVDDKHVSVHLPHVHGVCPCARMLTADSRVLHTGRWKRKTSMLWSIPNTALLLLCCCSAHTKLHPRKWAYCPQCVVPRAINRLPLERFTAAPEDNQTRHLVRKDTTSNQETSGNTDSVKTINKIN